MARIKKALAKVAFSQDGFVWKVALYIRLSRDDGDDKKESESVSNQKKILEDYMEKEFNGAFEIVDFYVDDGLTGTDDSRKEFMRMNYDVEQGKVNCIVVKTLARFARNHSDQGYYLEYYYPQHKVRFISLGEPKMDTYENPDAIMGLEVPIMGLMNDRFAATTSHNIRKTFKMKRERGEFIGGFAGYGFLKDPQDKNRLILDPDVVPIKHDMRDWVLRDGMSLAAIAKRLNTLKIPNPTAYKKAKGFTYKNPKSTTNDGMWCGTTVKRVLLNEANIGTMVQGRQRIISYKVHEAEVVPESEWFVVPDAIEPTFTQEEFDALKLTLARDTRTPKDHNTVFLFGGYLRCADCGKAMQRKKTRDVPYYVCRTYAEKSTSACTRHSIREDELEKAVLAAIQTRILLLEPLAEIVDEINTKPKVNTRSARLKQMKIDREKELAKARDLADNLFMDVKSELISMEDYTRIRAKLQDTIAQCKEALQNIEEELKKSETGVMSVNDAFKAFMKHRSIQTLDRTILGETVEEILVHEGKSISVRMRFGDELERVRIT